MQGPLRFLVYAYSYIPIAEWFVHFLKLYEPQTFRLYEKSNLEPIRVASLQKIAFDQTESK